MAAAIKSNKTWWIVGGIAAVAILFLFLRARSASGVSTLAPPPQPSSDPNALAGLNTLAQLASTQQLAQLQADVEKAREAAALEAAQLQADTQVKLAQQQGNTQTVNNVISTIGNIVTAGIAYGGRSSTQGSSGGAPVGGSYPGEVYI